MRMTAKFLRKDRPTLTCMVQARTGERILELIEKGLDSGADAFGVQLEQLEFEYRTRDWMKKIFSATDGKPVYVTNYRSGINEGISDEDRAKELISAAECGAALIDITGDWYNQTNGELTFDTAAVEKQKQFISDIHRLGAEVLMSSHTFRFMPKERALEYINEQHSRGADIAKLVSAANDDYELAENMSISAELSRDKHLPTLFLCVGDFCKRHRITAPLICGGMFLCVIEHDELATPVQPLLSDAKAAVELVYGE